MSMGSGETIFHEREPHRPDSARAGRSSPDAKAGVDNAVPIIDVIPPR
jgi:hypothetical protein